MGTFGKDAGAALVFLVLYTCMFCYMTFMYLTKRLKFNSRFTILYFHCLIRMASQVRSENEFHPTTTTFRFCH